MDILFLHGALGCKKHWEPFLTSLKTNDKIHLIDFVGHGENTQNVSIDFNHLIEQIKQFILNHQIKDFMIIGYSLGGYIGLKLASENMKGLNKLICIATQLDWDEEKAAIENKKITTESLMPIKEKLDSEHRFGYESIINSTHNILESIGKNPVKPMDLKQNKTPVYFLIGEKDKMVSKDFTQNFISEIPNKYIKTLPNQPHLLERMDLEILTTAINSICFS
jgi:pimeloyl-ACP methyl ester carboxylesterase